MATPKKTRTIDLKLRQAKLTNLNLNTEKHGEELKSRCDISLGFTIKDMEVDEIISAKGNPLKLFWHKDKTVMFREIKDFKVAFEAEGTLAIGVSDEHMVEFEGAKLGKITMSPQVELQAGIKCQVRVDPTGHLEALDEMLITGDVLLAFAGAEAEKADKQESLEV